MTPIFPVSESKKFLIASVARWLPSGIGEYAEMLVDMHLDTQNFPMPMTVDKQAMIAAMYRGTNKDELRTHITFEDTQTISGICRVLVRTHLNRSGINFVSRGFRDKTMAERVMGNFPVGFSPQEFTNWSGLLTAWLEFAKRSIVEKSIDEKGDTLFSSEDISSLEKLSRIPENEIAAIRRMPGIHNNWFRLVLGIHSGFKYLDDHHSLDAESVWRKLKDVSGSVGGIHQLIRMTSREIIEFGPTLAGSFYADLGNASFVKDDTHVLDSISSYMKVDKRAVIGDLAFKIMQNSANYHQTTPRAVDKIMYLAGSTNLYLFNHRLSKRDAPIEKQKFLAFLRNLPIRYMD